MSLDIRHLTNGEKELYVVTHTDTGEEFIDKLIERLEGREKYYHECALDEIMENGHTLDAEGFLGKEDAYGDAISIVNHIAEEYINTSTEHINCSTDTSTKLFGNSEQVNGGWIPCERALPKEDGYYLITIMYYHLHNPVVMGCCFEDGEWYKIDEDDKVVAWLPLPAPYTEGE